MKPLIIITMARKDEIYISFLKHELIAEKYDVKKEELPKSIREGLKSKNAIVKVLALIVDDTESLHPSSDKSLYSKITQFLNEESI